MIDTLEQHIVSRLRRVTVNSEPMRVLPYSPGRDSGETRYPCCWLCMRGFFQTTVDARPMCEVITPVGDEVTITLPYNMGGHQVSGTPSWDFKPYPTPTELYYELGAGATRISDHHKLLEGIFQAFPVGYTPTLSTQRPFFKLENVVEDDDFEKPLFVKIFMLRVTDLWLERAEIETYASMRDITLSCDVED